MILNYQWLKSAFPQGEQPSAYHYLFSKHCWPSAVTRVMSKGNRQKLIPISRNAITDCDLTARVQVTHSSPLKYQAESGAQQGWLPDFHNINLWQRAGFISCPQYSNGLATLVLILFSPLLLHLRQTVHLNIELIHTATEQALCHSVCTFLHWPSLGNTWNFPPRASHPTWSLVQEHGGNGVWQLWMNVAHSYISP